MEMGSEIGRNASVYIRGLDEYSSSEELNSVALFEDYPDHLISFAVGCCITFMIIGIPGNVITILALLNYKKVLNVTAIFIINLSLSDLLSCCVIIPIKINIFLNRHWIGGKVICMIYPIINYGLFGCSIFSIVAITINRYILVSHPSIYPKMYQSRNLMIMIFCIWFGAFTVLTPALTELWGRISLDYVNGFCTVVRGTNGSSPNILYIIICFIIPFTIIIACYSRIIWVVRKSTKKMSKRTNIVAKTDPTGLSQQEISVKDDNSEASGPLHGTLKRFKKTFRKTVKRPERPSKPTRKDKKLQTMTIATVITFFMCHLPLMIAGFVNRYSSNPCSIIMGCLMLYMSACSNPIIYVVLSSEYRQAYKHLFKKVLRITS